jgi:uncharacterized protein
MSSPSPISPAPVKPGFWRTQLRQWHWISSALCLIGVLLFSATGFTLNHAAQIEAKPVTVRVEKDLTPEMLADLPLIKDKQEVPARLLGPIKTLSGIDVTGFPADVSDEEIYIDMQGPGVAAFMSIDRADGHLSYERTERGVIAVLNDLHKGRHSGPVWSLFIDVLAIACVIFSLTGFGLLWIYAKGRRITWPLLGAGLLLPFIIFLLFVHS